MRLENGESLQLDYRLWDQLWGQLGGPRGNQLAVQLTGQLGGRSWSLMRTPLWVQLRKELP